MWASADAHTRAALGFSLLEVVEDNPRELRLADGRVARHPDGVLFRTEFTQVALVALAAAQLAELRAEGAIGDLTVAAGHSVGEFAALHALGALSLEAALSLVWQRGLAMQHHVPRAADGSSPYRLAVVKSLEGLPGDVEVVNHNAPGRQYAIVGTVDAIAALGRDARVVPGIDIPFHSSALRGAVDEFRPHVEAAGIDPSVLFGRWVPNVLARPLAPGDDVVELLARQLASPVRWIECQQALAGLVGRFLEVAPAHAAVLTGLAKLTVPDVELLHAEHDRDVVLERAVASAPAAVPAGADASARDESTRADVSAAPASPPSAGSPIADRPVDAGDALEFVLALQARVRLDQLDPSESVDELFQGVSSRRNQVLIDLGREFGLSGAEGVQRQTIGELVKSLREQGAAYRFPGPYLKDALATGLTRAGVPRTDLGLPPGLTDHVFARVALDTRPGPSARGGDLARLSAGPDVLDRALALTVHRPEDPAHAPRRTRTGRRPRRRREPRARRRAAGLRAHARRRARPPVRAARRAAARHGPGQGPPGRPRCRVGRRARNRDRPAVRRPPSRALRLGLGQRPLGPRHRLPRRARRPDRRRHAPRRARPHRRARGGEDGG